MLQQQPREDPHRDQHGILLTDSFREPLPAGTRSSHESSRLLTYRYKNKTIDILMTPEKESGRVLLVGQVTGDDTRMGKDNDLLVLLTDGMNTVARTTTNQFGEFQLEFEIMEDPGLQIRLREGSWVVIALGKMDWARKPGTPARAQTD